MDTKWKSIKKILCFVVFFLGVSMTVWNVSELLRRLPENPSSWKSGILPEEDYQKTWSFQNFMTNRLENFLSVAVNGRMGGWYYYGDAYYDGGWESDAWLEERALMEGTATTDSAVLAQDFGVCESSSWEDCYGEEWEDYYDGWEGFDGWDYGYNDWEYWYDGYEWYERYLEMDPKEREALTEEQKKRAELLEAREKRIVEKYFSDIEGDLNLLYSISYDGKLLYSNSELLVADGSMQVPEGYNFLLYFDGEKVRIVKDGKEVDIYGDGYYRDDENDWYVPGYRNFPATEGMKKAVICMAAAKEPLLYTTGMDKSGGYRQQNNSLYWMRYNCAMDTERLRGNVIGLGVGIVLLFFSCFCRRGIREAAEGVAHVQGKIWVECKVLLLIAVLFAGLRECTGYYGDGLWQEIAYANGYRWEAVREYGGILLSDLRYMPSLFWVVLFWTEWFTENDLRHNKKVWRHGLIAKLAGMVSAREMKLPMARRMARRNALLLAAIVVCGILVLVGTLTAANHGLWRYHSIGSVILWCVLVTACLFLAAWLVGGKNIRTAREVDLLSARIGEICRGNYSGFYEGGNSRNETAWNGKGAGDGRSAGDGLMSGTDEATGAASGSEGSMGSGAEQGTGGSMGSGAESMSGGSMRFGAESVPGGSMRARTNSGIGGGMGPGAESGFDGAMRFGMKTGAGGLWDSELGDTMVQLENIRQGMASAVDEQMKSERMKVELIANVSHDLKTPLTSIISYVQFLKEEQGLPGHVQDYVKILDEKSQRLKNMVQDVFAVSKAASGELPMNMEKLDFAKLLRQTMADMDEEIQNSRVTFRTELPEEPVMIMADGQRMYRVFQNLFQNALKYSLDGSRVYVNLKADGKLAVASVKNTSHMELDEDKHFTERFVRGDRSRTDGGSGLGLSIAQSFTEACGGHFELEFNADLFIVTVSFETTEGENSTQGKETL